MTLLEAHKIMMDRYLYIAREIGDEHLIKFCTASNDLVNPDKLSRWVGYVQGTLIERGVLDTKFERDFSRPIYQPIYAAQGYTTETIEIS